MMSKEGARRSVVLLGLGFVILIASVACAIWLSVLQEQSAGWVQHTLEVENRLGVAGRLVTDAETGQRGYLLSGVKSYLAPYEQARRAIPGVLRELEETTRDNPAQRNDVLALSKVINSRLALLGTVLVMADAGHRTRALELIKDGVGQRQMHEIRALLDRMVEREEALLAERTATAHQRTQIGRIALVVSALLVMILAYIAVRDAWRRITALRKANARLREEVQARSEAQSQVRQLQKMEAVGQLTGGIAHDFNNMLAIIVGSLDIAQLKLKSGDGTAVARSIDHAQEGAQRAASLTAQLLAFSRRQPLEPRVLDANKLVRNVSEMLRRTLGEQIHIETVLAGGLWRIHADPEQVESAVVNLAVNARDAMPEGGKLTIETGNSELDERYAREHEEVNAGQYVMLSITDTGMGMTQDVIDRAFEPFFTTKDVGRGTGLGLSQVFGFVKQSAGHIKIYSEPGRGTTVKLYLPRYNGAAEPIFRPGDQSEEMPRGKPNEVVLVVEDDPQVRQMSVEAIRDFGYTVTGVAGGAEALATLASRGDVTLLFTDIVMPDMTGRVLAERALIAHPDLKVLYTTGYTRNAIVHHGVVDYGVAFIQKPFTLAALARKIRDVLDGNE